MTLTCTYFHLLNCRLTSSTRTPLQINSIRGGTPVETTQIRQWLQWESLKAQALPHTPPALMWNVMQRWLVVTDVSGQLIGTIFTSVTKDQSTLRNIPEEWRRDFTLQRKPSIIQRVPLFSHIVFTGCEQFYGWTAIISLCCVNRLAFVIDTGRLLRGKNNFLK